MRHRTLAFALLSAALLFLFASENGLAQKVQKKGGAEAVRQPPVRLPASLDELYPPKAKEPVLLMKMHAMSNALTGTLVDLFENDAPNAKANYELFRKEYDAASKLVPVWASAFPRGPVDQFGKALASGDQGKVMGAVQKVGQICENCHVNNMTPVQQKYHWPDFRNVGVTDPVMKTDVDYKQLMMGLNLGFTGVAVNLQQGQPENARKSFEAFKARFETMEGTCIACHDSERKYYVDASVKATIDQLGAAISSSQIDPAKVQQLSMSIGTESCFKCHLVHLPAAHAKERWGGTEVSMAR